MEIRDAMETIGTLAAATGADEFDVVGYDSMSESVEVFEQKISNTEIQKSSALGLRLFKNGRPGIAFTERLSAEALKICVDDAVAHTQLTDSVGFKLPQKISVSTSDFNRRSNEFAKVTLADLAGFAKKIEAETRSADARIENVPYTGAARSQSISYFLNSHGVSYSLTHEDFSAYTAAVSVAGEQKKMGIYSNARREFSELSTLNIARRAAERSVEQLGAHPVASGKYRVLFSNRVSGQIISMYASPYFAEMVIRGQSRLKGKLGEDIASDIFSLSSQPHDEHLPGSRALDSEGHATKNIIVVDKGKLTHFLYNLEAAAHDKVNPTGNGTRSVGSKASTGFKNMVVPTGTLNVEEYLAKESVLVIDKLEGAAGCSAISGEMSIGAQGYLYEKGERKQAVDRITLSSNYFEMLKNIEAIGNAYNDQLSSVRVPALLIADISVAG